jgi:NAD(P)-dependent dehydrogenase (short-subunit alcohol dehydrogenase family)
MRVPNRNLLVGAGLLTAAVGLREVLGRSRQAELAGQSVLVTGGSHGLGFLLAREFAAEGCRVAICARDPQELAEAQQALAGAGQSVTAVACDVGKPDEVRRLLDEVAGRHGRIDILVNNAGVIQVGPIDAMSVSDFEQALDTMFWGMVHPTLAVLPEMLEQRGGRIVNVTSIGGKLSAPHLLPYSCAKFAAVAFSEGLRAELDARGVKVTTIVPGLMRTGSYLNAFFKGRRSNEFTFFALAASLPLVSMDGERAARQVVRATRRGEPERILSTPANLAARVHGAFPELTLEVMALVNRLLPSAQGGSREAARGVDIWREVRSPLLSATTSLGLAAARRFQPQALTGDGGLAVGARRRR